MVPVEINKRKTVVVEDQCKALPSTSGGVVNRAHRATPAYARAFSAGPELLSAAST